jgi:hypothetical protein
MGEALRFRGRDQARDVGHMAQPPAAAETVETAALGGRKPASGCASMSSTMIRWPPGRRCPVAARRNASALSAWTWDSTAIAISAPSPWSGAAKSAHRNRHLSSAAQNAAIRSQAFFRFSSDVA